MAELDPSYEERAALVVAKLLKVSQAPAVSRSIAYADEFQRWQEQVGEVAKAAIDLVIASEEVRAEQTAWVATVEQRLAELAAHTHEEAR